MEEAMPARSAASESLGLTGVADRFLVRWRDWWRARDELRNLDRQELQRIARDFGMSARDLEDLAARGPDAAELLYERMHALGIARADAERIAWGLIRDLEKTCSGCCDKRMCRKDLAEHPQDPAWKAYCPNAVALEAIANAKGRFPA
jgi:hypothetical protein